MTDDLVKRLFAEADAYDGDTGDLLRRAGARIAALEAELERLKAPASDEQIRTVAIDAIDAMEDRAEPNGFFTSAEYADAVLAAVASKIEARVRSEDEKTGEA